MQTCFVSYIVLTFKVSPLTSDLWCGIIMIIIIIIIIVILMLRDYDHNKDN